MSLLCCCSVSKSHPTLCDPMGYSIPGLSVLHYLLELLKFVSIESVVLSNHLIPLPPRSPFAFHLSQHQGLFQLVSSSHQVAKVPELQLQHVLPMNIQGWSPLGLTGLQYIYIYIYAYICIYISNYYIIDLMLTQCYMSIISQNWKKKRKLTSHLMLSRSLMLRKHLTARVKEKLSINCLVGKG